MDTLLTAGTVLTPLEAIENGAILVTDGRVVTCGRRGILDVPADARRLDFPDSVIAPGFIDLHTHGAVGFDVMDASPADFAQIGRMLASHGVTSYLAATVTAPRKELIRALSCIADAIEQPSPNEVGPCAHLLGIHLEGPFISFARSGVHPPTNIEPVSLSLFHEFIRASRNHVKMMTVAPELSEATELIRVATSSGICVSMGHTNATGESVTAAIAAGARHATHTFNAMRPIEHREPSIVTMALTDDRLFADIIADGVHVSPEIVKMFVRCKGVDRAVLISDSTSATGMPPGRYRLGLFVVQVDGLRCESQGRLAGSVLTLDLAVRNVMHFAGWTLQDAVRLVTLNPARVLGIEANKGVIAPGADADLVVLSPEGEVQKTFVAGQGL